MLAILGQYDCTNAFLSFQLPLISDQFMRNLLSLKEFGTLQTYSDETRSGSRRFAFETMCPAVNTPIANPMINVPNNMAALGSVTVKNNNLVSTACVFCKTTITTTNTMRAIAKTFSFCTIICH